MTLGNHCALGNTSICWKDRNKLVQCPKEPRVGVWFLSTLALISGFLFCSPLYYEKAKAGHILPFTLIVYAKGYRRSLHISKQ